MAGDYWNTVGVEGDNPGELTTPPLKYGNRSASPVQVTLKHIGRLWGWESALKDPMYNSYYFSTGSMELSFAGIPAGNYDIYLYGHGDHAEHGIKFQLLADNTAIGEKETSTTDEAISGASWQEGVQYVVFKQVAIKNGGLLGVAIKGLGQWTVINGMQIIAVK